MAASKNTRKKLRNHLEMFASETEQNNATVYADYNIQLRVISDKNEKARLRTGKSRV